PQAVGSRPRAVRGRARALTARAHPAQRVRLSAPNFAAVEWPANIKIGKKPPADYVPPLDHAMSAEERDRLYGWHALPPLWWELPYHEFLVQRRVRMADVIRQAWGC
uniref:hypothetical protein n=1 Tax=Mesorhizobium mediterraneum TaxID=43617 RepID=UPI001AEEEF02